MDIGGIGGFWWGSNETNIQVSDMLCHSYLWRDKCGTILNTSRSSWVWLGDFPVYIIKVNFQCQHEYVVSGGGEQMGWHLFCITDHLLAQGWCNYMVKTMVIFSEYIWGGTTDSKLVPIIPIAFITFRLGIIYGNKGITLGKFDTGFPQQLWEMIAMLEVKVFILV